MTIPFSQSSDRGCRQSQPLIRAPCATSGRNSVTPTTRRSIKPRCDSHCLVSPLGVGAYICRCHPGCCIQRQGDLASADQMATAPTVLSTNRSTKRSRAPKVALCQVLLLKSREPARRAANITNIAVTRKPTIATTAVMALLEALTQAKPIKSRLKMAAARAKFKTLGWSHLPSRRRTIIQIAPAPNARVAAVRTAATLPHPLAQTARPICDRTTYCHCRESKVFNGWV